MGRNDSLEVKQTEISERSALIPISLFRRFTRFERVSCQGKERGELSFSDEEAQAAALSP